MQLKIYDRTVYFKLTPSGKDSIHVSIVDDFGNQVMGGNLFNISVRDRDKIVVRAVENVNSGFGFELDSRRRVKVRYE